MSDNDSIRATRRDKILLHGKNRLEKIASTLGAPVPSIEKLSRFHQDPEPYIEESHNHFISENISTPQLSQNSINTNTSEHSEAVNKPSQTVSTGYSWIVILLHILYGVVYYLYPEYLQSIPFTISFCTMLVIERSTVVILLLLFSEKNVERPRIGLNVQTLYRVLVYHLVFYVLMHSQVSGP